MHRTHVDEGRFVDPKRGEVHVPVSGVPGRGEPPGNGAAGSVGRVAHLPAIRSLAQIGIDQVPPMIAREGESAAWRFIEFFTANIRNPNTRRAYARAVGNFFRWCEQRVRDVAQISPTVVASYIEHRGRTHAKPTVKQELAAVRMLFDWLVVGHVLAASPAHAVRGPKHVIKRGKTPVLTREETRELLDGIETDDIAGLRDRALIGLLVFSFARIGAALTLKVDDYFPEGKRWKLRLHEKGGKEHVVPVHHVLEEYLDAYLDAASIRDQAGGPLFRTLATAPGRPLSVNPMRQADAWRMIRRRARAAGIPTKIGCHTFRASGITAYLENGGTLERAQQIAAHESPRTTKLYDRTADHVSLDEIERIRI